MVSRFESTFRDRVIPAAERAFGVTVFFIFGDDSELSLTGMVDLQEMPADDSGFIAVEGKLTIKTSLLTSKLRNNEVLPSVRVREQLFHVYDQSPPHCGLTVFNIRRNVSEQKHTNIYDMSDRQAVWTDNANGDQ